jgi:hypothetical protein
LLEHREAFEHLYHSLSGESEPVNAMRTLLKSVLDIQVPEVFALHHNYPNPFNPVTSIRFELPEQQQVTLTIYNLLGQVVTTLASNQFYGAGVHTVELDASRLSSGIYFYCIQAGQWQATRKMVVLK